MQREQPKSTENNERPKQLIYNQKQTKATKSNQRLQKNIEKEKRTYANIFLVVNYWFQ